MAELSIYQRLDRILSTLTTHEFLHNRGLGNEIGFHIFDYEPEYELLVREHAKKVIEKLNKPEFNLPVLEINLFNLILQILEERVFLQKAIEHEKKKGAEGLLKALKPLLRPEKLGDIMAGKVSTEHKIVFITGIGEDYPLIRTHSILNNLHSKLDHIPVVLFFSGSYDGQDLRLFSTLKDDNYYRAFQLVPKIFPGKRRLKEG